MNRTTLSAVAAAVMLALPAAGQQLRQRVRVRGARIAKGPVVGTVTALKVDTLTLAVDAGKTHLGDTLAVPIRDIARFEVSRGIGSAAGRGAGLGAAIGIPLGLMYGIAAHASCENQSNCYFDSGGPEAIGGAILGGGVGALVGLVIGSTRRVEHWEDAPMVRLGAALAPDGGRVLLLATVLF